MGTELALAELRGEIDSLKGQHDTERPDEGVQMQGDENEPMKKGAARLRGFADSWKRTNPTKPWMWMMVTARQTWRAKRTLRSKT